jgi:hypothetical protein
MTCASSFRTIPQFRFRLRNDAQVDRSALAKDIVEQKSAPQFIRSVKRFLRLRRT